MQLFLFHRNASVDSLFVIWFQSPIIKTFDFMTLSQYKSVTSEGVYWFIAVVLSVQRKLWIWLAWWEPATLNSVEILTHKNDKLNLHMSSYKLACICCYKWCNLLLFPCVKTKHYVVTLISVRHLFKQYLRQF